MLLIQHREKAQNKNTTKTAHAETTTQKIQTEKYNTKIKQEK